MYNVLVPTKLIIYIFAVFLVTYRSARTFQYDIGWIRQWESSHGTYGIRILAVYIQSPSPLAPTAPSAWCPRIQHESLWKSLLSSPSGRHDRRIGTRPTSLGLNNGQRWPHDDGAVYNIDIHSKISRRLVEGITAIIRRSASLSQMH